jgi:iron complex outermembrane receptor protein
MLPNQGLDIGIKKEVLKGKGSLNVRVSDVFATRFFGLDIDDVTFVQHLERRFESRIGWLGFTYRFGKSDNAQKQRPERPKQEDRGADNMDF